MNYNAYYAAGVPPVAPDKPAAIYPSGVVQAPGVLSASPPAGLGPSYPQQGSLGHPGSAGLARPPAAYPSHLAAQPAPAGYPGAAPSAAMYHQPSLQTASPYGAALYAPASTLAMPQPSHAGMGSVLTNGPYAGATMGTGVSQASQLVAPSMAATTHGMGSMYPYPTYSVSPISQGQLAAARGQAMPGYPASAALHAPLSSYPTGVAMASGPPYNMVSASPYRPVP